MIGCQSLSQHTGLQKLEQNILQLHAKHSGHNMIGCHTCQPKQEDKNLKLMTPAVVKWTADGVDKMGHCGSREVDIWAEVTLAIKVQV